MINWLKELFFVSKEDKELVNKIKNIFIKHNVKVGRRSVSIKKLVRDNDENRFEVIMIYEQEDLVYRLKKRAEIRRQISTRKSVQEGKPDRIADLLEEAAREIEYLRNEVDSLYEDLAGDSL